MKCKIALGIAAVTLASSLQAESPSDHWRSLARIDAEAAIALIEESHPGSAPELGDSEFLKRLETARAHVEQRLPKVSSYEGHAALLSGLANDFGDGHIWSNARLSSSRRSWAGLIMVRRGGQWVVGAQDRAESEPSLDGARLLDCDGVGAAQFGRSRLGQFYADADVEADLATNAARLLLDDGNPFLVRPKACRFDRDGKISNVTLNWRTIAVRQLEEIASKALAPAQAGIGVNAFAGGQWIELGTLGNEAQAGVEAVRANQAALRTAPMVVVDMRGNSGGNSAYADSIARTLVGDRRVDAADYALPACSGQFWRVSDGNIDALEEFVRNLPDERRTAWQEQLSAMRKAKANGQRFSPNLPACAKSTRPGTRPKSDKLPKPEMAGRLVLVTDRSCFSSCLIATDLFRALGALHVGEATDRSTRYMEVREILLPSGLRTFSTLQKASVGMSYFGPYSPSVIYPGSLADTDALKAWLAALPAQPR